MTILFLYPNDMFTPFAADEEFADEENFAKKVGFDTAFLDSMELESNNIKIKGVIPEGSTVIYRGWMLSPERYELLNTKIVQNGSKLFTSPENYIKAHYMSGWVNSFGELTFSTELFDAPIDVEFLVNNVPNWSGFFIKDYVKSVHGFTHEIKKDELDNAVHGIIAEQDSWLAGGIAVREFVNIPHDAVELRAWWVEGKWHIMSHPKFATVTGTPDVPNFLLDSIDEILTNLSVKFVTVDLVQLTSDVWKVIEIGDGQVSGLPHRNDEGMHNLDIQNIFNLFK
jgi:hypothetical protein